MRGRTCPIDYLLTPQEFEVEPRPVETLYALGGLYGNRWALDAALALAEKEGAQVALHGDYHWFDAEPQAFEALEKSVAPLAVSLGNVEAELLRPGDEAGCGCAYPEGVDDEAVERSNQIHLRLKAVARQFPQLLRGIKSRPRLQRYLVAGQQVLVVHGDEASLAGWGNSQENLSQPERRDCLKAWMAKHGVDVLLCSHTCAPAYLASDWGVVANNGAAGMPNWQGGWPLLTRLSATPHLQAMARARRCDLWVEALPIVYDDGPFTAWFDRLWPAGSSAAVSYRDRITGRLNEAFADALLGGFALVQN